MPDEFFKGEKFIDLESVNDPNIESVSQNKYCQGINFVYGSPIEPCEGMIFDESEEAKACTKHMQGERALAFGKLILDCLARQVIDRSLLFL